MEAINNRTSIICDTPFWDAAVSWDTSCPDFTPCFQKTVLQWLPGLFLLLMVPVYVAQIRSSIFPSIPPSKMFNKKMVSIGCLFTLQVVNALKAVHEFRMGGENPLIDILSPLVSSCFLMLVIYMTYQERKHGVLSSGVFFFYWLLMACCQLAVFQSKIREVLQTSVYLQYDFLHHLTTCVITLQVFLSTFSTEIPEFLRKPNKKGEMPSPMTYAPFLSYMSTFWMTSFLINGFKNTVKRSDLYAVPKTLSCEYTMTEFEQKWKNEKERVKRLNASPKTKKQPDEESSRPNVFRALIKSFWSSIMILPLCRFLGDSTSFVHPFILKLMISFADNSEDHMWKGILFVSVLFFVGIGQSFLHKMNRHFFHRLHFNIVTTLQCAIYRKTMVLSNSSRKSTTVGEMNNLLSTDAQKIPHLFHILQDTWSIPFRVIFALYLLYQEVGSAVVYAVIIILACIPLNTLMSKLEHKYQKTYKDYSDSRAKVINEIINGIKVIKLYGWEKSFEKKIDDIRKNETKQLTKIRIKQAFGRLLWTFTPELIGIAVFGTYISEGGARLTTETIFVCLALINVLSFPMTALPHIINFAIEAKVSVKRLQDFMALEELDAECIQNNPAKGMAVTIEDCEFAWSKDSKNSALKNLTFEIEEGSLVAVVGSVGSGKSSLCAALLGEMEKIQGNAHVKGSIAYVPQQPWIQNLKLQDNILFGKSKQNKRYQNVIKNCALESDLKLFSSGDQTEIGEKGINLSGGQKQRVNLARAIYQDADLYLLDDPLSAVDAHVGKHIFNHVIGPRGMLKNKTRILVTHALHVLPKVDKIIVLTNGEITETGCYEDLMENNSSFAELVLNFSLNQRSEDSEKVIQINEDSVGTVDSLYESSDSDSEESEYTSSSSDSEEDLNEDIKISNDSLNAEYANLMSEDVVETGKIKNQTYVTFFKAIGIKTTFLFFILKLGVICMEATTTKWLKHWSQDISTGNITLDKEQNMYRYSIYSFLNLCSGVLTVMFLLALAWISQNGSVILHSKLLKAILRYPMSFFDTTPIGRITTRFSKDMDVIDSALPSRLEWGLHHLLTASIAIMVVASEVPYVLVAYIPVIFIFILIFIVYNGTSRQLKRIESVAHSPIFSHYSESVQGLSTIRAYKQEERFYVIHKEKTDEYLTCGAAVMTSNLWLSTTFEILGSLIVLFSLLCALFERDVLTGAAVGIILNYTFRITGDTNAFLQHMSEMDKNMVSAEKVIHYSELEQEAADVIEEHRPKYDWPKEGKVQFVNFATRYRKNQDLVVKNINFTIEPGQKIGIVGRTGAGKSSLTLAFFRIIESAKGCIKIDGLDISTIGLHDLRSKLTIIPQDPVMFMGTIRQNLDPFEEYTDSQIWEAIEHAHLKNYIDSLRSKLDYECAEDGKNLSIGQRQLICLARALLRKTKILILDEATAAVDLETDDLIQTTIRKEFKDCTILTIAHRLNTIIDYDKILVLDAGEMAEFDAPHALLENTNGHFAKLAKDAGLSIERSDTDSGIES